MLLQSTDSPDRAARTICQILVSFQIHKIKEHKFILGHEYCDWIDSFGFNKPGAILWRSGHGQINDDSILPSVESYSCHKYWMVVGFETEEWLPLDQLEVLIW